MQTPPITAAEVLAELEKHVGKSTGIHVRDLVARVTGLVATAAAQERRARELISELRQQGHRICGKPESGYFMAATHEELLETCDYLRRRALTGLVIESQMRRISMPELLGQINLSLDLNPQEGKPND